MASLLQVDRVKYLCSCGHYESLCRLYFCRHCSVLRCRECVTHEVDSTYCPSCLENMPSGEARVKKNRCGTCFECPLCSMTLAVRATSVLPPGAMRAAGESSAASSSEVSTTGGATPTKAYYLLCNSCRWSTRDAAIADQSSATAGWPVHIDHNEKNFNDVLEQFKSLASVEKTERERKKYTKRRSNMGNMFSDKYGLQAIYNRRRLGIGMTEKSEKGSGFGEPVVEPSENVPELPEDIFTREVVPDQVAKIEQRIAQPLAKNSDPASFYPVHKPLMIRRSLRCKECDHNLCKGEYNPSSIKFKIQMFGLLHVPEVRLMEPPLLVVGEKCVVKLTLSNLSAALTHLVLLPNAAVLDDAQFADANVPVCELVIPHRDETAELDEAAEAPNPYKDDPDVVIFRKRHKIGIQLTVTPKATSTNVWMSMIMKYDYVNTFLSSGDHSREPEIALLQQTVKINLGSLGESTA